MDKKKISGNIYDTGFNGAVLVRDRFRYGRFTNNPDGSIAPRSTTVVRNATLATVCSMRSPPIAHWKGSSDGSGAELNRPASASRSVSTAEKIATPASPALAASCPTRRCNCERKNEADR